MKKIKTNKKSKGMYFYIETLRLSIHTSPGPHVKLKEIEEKLTKTQYKLFHKIFGIQTMIVVDGKGEPYPWDVEAVLARIFDNKITGSQKFWD